MRSGSIVPATLPWIAATLGCAGNVSAPGDTTDAEPGESTTAIVVVERSGNPTGSTETTRGEAVARFVRIRGVAGDDALRVVGASLDLPAVGECGATGGGTSTASWDSPPIAQLVDVGAVSVIADGLETSLPVRRLPDVVDCVSGVFYARATEALPANARYVLRVSADGADDMAPFEISAFAPADPNDVRAELTPQGDLELTWEAGAPDDVLYVDVGSSSAGPLRCTFADASGRAVIAAGVLAGGTAPEGEPQSSIVVHRLHRERFVARGIEAGEVRFDFARALSFERP